MTPAEERTLVDSAVAAVEAAARDAQRQLVELIIAGVPPADAVKQSVSQFQGEFAVAVAAALSQILEEAIGEAAVLRIQVGPVSLSSRLYAEALAVSAEVRTVVQEHALGFQDARKLALQLFEGYGFRPPDQEPLKFNPAEPRLPKYLRELVDDAELASGFDRSFARIQINGLATGALRAAYSELLDAIDALAEGKGARRLEKRLEVAFYERVRYFATRIARTELHRAYADREALMLMADTDVEFIQVRRAPGRHNPCICALITGRDQFGLGAGVYPKARAPRPPFHPHCLCNLSPRLDLTGRKVPDEQEGADVSFLKRLGEPLAARVMGSKDRLERVFHGEQAERVANTGRPDAYRIKTVGG